MESRAFIKAATVLVKRIEDNAVLRRVGLSDNSQLVKNEQEIQKEIHMLFAGLQNPTLMAAANLADVAQQNRYSVQPAALQKLAQFSFLG